jgi:NYN domain
MKTSRTTAARLGIPAELVALAGPSADVALLYDLDYLSHAGPRGFRVDDATLASLTRIVEASASSLGSLRYVRAACSTETAAVHRLVLAGTANNTWRAVTGRHGADTCIVGELDHLARTRRMRLVVLVAGDHVFARPVAALRAAGVAVWVVHRPGSLSWRLYRAATSATALPPVSA